MTLHERLNSCTPLDILVGEKEDHLFLFMAKRGFVQDTVKYTYQIYSMSFSQDLSMSSDSAEVYSNFFKVVSELLVAY